ncbi:trafficking kinesin-binding protein 1-like, partial [Diadema setosum]|uniref:trafficking kinesin-binding protein 1-like n=1 Tax=Diadema setosum TaxID=31175 RepID=UPI003B3A3E09
ALALSAVKLATDTESEPSHQLTEEHFVSGQSDGEDDAVTTRIQEAGTLTDLHNTSNIPEVEIFSLLEEQIPLYTLRADTTSHYSYEHDDWLGSAASAGLVAGGSEMNDDDRYILSSEMMEETLKYFTLCGDRVVQMTRTYNDIDAVTKLLEEKEKDLELAAKIGQSLLQQNKQLEARIELIEENLTVIGDQNTQLHHEIKLKNDLLRIYTNDIGQSDSEDEGAWSDKNKMCIQSKFIDIDTLQKKIKNLEEENLNLRIETAELRTTTTCIEEKEEQLVRDCFKELAESRGSVEILTEELSKKFEDNMRLQEEVTTLLAQVVDVQQKVKKLTVENEEMHQHLQASKDAQQELTQELLEMREKYDEVYRMLQEAQETAKRSNRNSMPRGSIGFGPYYNPLPVFPADSLAAELVDSVEQRLEKDPHLSKKGKREYNKNVMKTVKVVNRRSHNSPGSGYSSDFYSQKTSPSSSVISLVGSERSDMYEGDSESINSPTGASSSAPVSSIPGSNDLATALRRLKLRQQNEKAEQEYAERHADSDRCPTPESMVSGLSGISGISTVPAGGGGQSFRGYMPEKLQIVKPMEGSMALHHWQRLATPHMASMLDSRPGVVVKGFREIDTKRDAGYHLDDIEDDGCVVGTYPSKGFANTSSTYTYTTSRMGQMGNTMMTSTNPFGTRMTIDLQSHPPSPGVYDPPPGASLGIASVLATPEVTSGSAVRLKASQTTAAPRSKRSSIGLNFLSTSPNSEKKAELDVEAPSGVHKVSGQIFSRNASPMSSISSGIKILDPETKARLMEKVRSIRAEKAAISRASTYASRMTSASALVSSYAPRMATTGALASTYTSGMVTTNTPRMATTGALASTYTSGMVTTNTPRMATTGALASTYTSGMYNTNTPRMATTGALASTYSSGMVTTNTPRMVTTNALVPAPPMAVSIPRANLGLEGLVMSSTTSPRMSATSGGPSLSAQGTTSSLSSAGPIMSSGTVPKMSSGLASPSSSAFPPVLGQSRQIASPMAVLAASHPVTSTSKAAVSKAAVSKTSEQTPAAGLGGVLDLAAPSGLGNILDLEDSPNGKTVVSKSRPKSGKRL